MSPANVCATLGEMIRISQPREWGFSKRRSTEAGSDRGLITRLRLSTVAFVLLFGSVSSADLIEQIVTPSPASQLVLPDTAFNFDVNYTTNDPDETSTGLGLRMHFDSSELTFDSLTNQLNTSKVGDATVVDDSTDNFDGDANTDMFVNLGWFDITGSWPGSSRLYTANFTTKPTFLSSTMINFTARSTAGTAVFSSTSSTINATPEPGSLTLLLVAAGSFAAYRYRRKRRLN